VRKKISSRPWQEKNFGPGPGEKKNSGPDEKKYFGPGPGPGGKMF